MTEDFENETGLREVYADEILGKIEIGELFIEYNRVIVKGNLDGSKLDMAKDKKGKLLVPSIIIIRNSIIKGSVDFSSCALNDSFSLEKTTIEGYAYFKDTDFLGDAYFIGTKFENSAVFWDSTFKYADFSESQFKDFLDFSGSKFSGETLTFESAVFVSPLSQEDACRRAKIVLETNGDRDGAGYHFYREMDGKRKRKRWYSRYPEFVFIQLIFGYGVHPFRLMFCWFLVALIFAIFYSANGGIIGKLPASSLPQSLSYFVECFYFSIVTAVTPGYGKYELTSGVYQVIASAEAIFGTFMWAAFIATFARKYMR